MKWLIVVITAFVALTSCGRRGATLEPFRWEAAGGEFDSITVALEYDFYDWRDMDSVRERISRMGVLACADTMPMRAVKMSRWFYNRGRLHMREGLDSLAVRELDSALAFNDSARYPYDWHRIRNLRITSDERIGVSHVADDFDEIDFARSVGDEMLEAMALQIIGLRVGDLQPEKGLAYLLRADSLTLKHGFRVMALKNQINISNMLRYSGRVAEADSVLRALIVSEDIQRHAYAHNSVRQNLFLTSGNVAYLRSGYRDIANVPKYRGQAAEFECMLADYYSRTDPDSADFFAARAFRRIDSIDDFGLKSVMALGYARTLARRRQWDSAYAVREQAAVYRDSANMLSRPKETMMRQYLRELDTAEARRERERQAWMTRLMAVAVMVLLAGSVAFAIISRHRSRLEMDKINARLELEKAHRRVLASSLAIEENDRLLGAVREHISSMCREGRICRDDALRLESALKNRMSDRADWNGFSKQFEAVSPAFVRNLYARCPGLPDSYVKIASMIFMGLDNKQIAGFMNIRTESVHQARWRLRSKLGVAEGSTLEEFLRSLDG